MAAVILITPDLLVRAMGGARREHAEVYALHLDAACRRYDIDTVDRVAALLGQLAIESGRLRYAEEIWGPTPTQERYEGREDLGNARPGDGRRYRGRGLLQVTGRANYRRLTTRLRAGPYPDAPDFELDPDALALPLWAAVSACDWWAAHDCSRYADDWEIARLSRLINRGNARAELAANHEAERIDACDRARTVLLELTQDTPDEVPAPIEDPVVQLGPEPGPHIQQERPTMPIPAFLAAALPALVELLPRLGKVFGSGSQVAERNIRAAEIVAETVQRATSAPNIQTAVEAMRSDPAALQAAAQAVEQRWWEIAEAGGGGIDGARKADQAMRTTGDLLHSASFWVALMLLPLVYLLVLSLIGMIGTATWSDDVRAGLAGSLISAVVGGLVGYYYGQTTSRNRATGATP